MSEQLAIKVPNLGGVDDSKVIEVLVTVGQMVEVDEGLITLESDKASMEIPSPHAGKVKAIHISVGDVVKEGAVIVDMVASGVKHDEPLEKDEGQIEKEVNASPQPETKQDKKPEAGSSRVRGSDVYAGPFVRRMAFEFGIDLKDVPTQNEKGRVAVEDIKRYLQKSAPVVSYDQSQWGKLEDVALTRVQSLSAKHLLNVWQTVPQVTQHHMVDITDLEKLRKGIKDTKVTMISFVMKVTALLMKSHQSFNLVWHQADMARRRSCYHIGFAVETDQGLIVPVCRDVDQKSILQIVEEIQRLSQQAREGKLNKKDLQGGCATISSLGGIGGGHFTPIVNAPEAFIIGLARASFQPVYQGDDLVRRYVMPISLSYDHRLIDGAEGARFVVEFAKLLEELPKVMGEDVLSYTG